MRFNEFTEQNVNEGYYDLNSDLPGMEPIGFSSNPSFKDLITRYTQLVYQGHTSETSPEEDQEHDEIEQYVAQHFGEKGSAHLQKAAEVSYWGRDDGKGSGHIRSSNLGRPSQPGGNFRTTKSGKMHGQDVKMMKNKVADRLGRHPEPALPEGIEEAGFGRATGRAAWDSNMPGYQGDYGGAENWGRREREDDEHHEIDRRMEQEREYRNTHGTWYVRIDGLVQPTPYTGKAAANAAALELKKQPGNENKVFMLTTKA